MTSGEIRKVTAASAPEEIRAEMNRVQRAMKASGSRYLRNDYGRYLRRLRKLLRAAAAMVIILAVGAGAAERETEKMWVLCNPDSYVCIRETPKKGAIVGGYLYCGDEVETDGIVKGEWRHVVGVSTEAGEGWVHDGYLDYSEPQAARKNVRVTRGKTRARSCMGGEVTRTLKKGTVLTVYAENLEWSVTSAGYIKTDLLEEIRQ